MNRATSCEKPRFASSRSGRQLPRWIAHPGRSATLVLLGLSLAGVVQLLPWRVGVVDGSSMTPTFRSGDLFLYTRSPASTSHLRRGDVVVLQHNGETWIKRVYAAGGDRFWAYCEDDGESKYHVPIAATQLGRFRRLADRVRAGKFTKAQVRFLTIPPGQLFIMGDSAVSDDSRTLGLLSAEDVIGRVIASPGRRVDRMPGRLELSWLTPQRQIQPTHGVK